jgi:hypothetical protein
MKLVTRILSLLVLATLATLYMGCGGDDGDDQSEEEKQFNKLKSTWELESASDGTNRNADFEGLILTLSGSFAQGGTFQYDFNDDGERPNPSPWPDHGTWEFGQNPSRQITLHPGEDDEIDAEYEVTDASLQITFDIPDGHPGYAGSRINSVEGEWTFVFKKQQ